MLRGTSAHFRVRRQSLCTSAYLSESPFVLSLCTLQEIETEELLRKESRGLVEERKYGMMSGTDLWKYCTAGQVRETLRGLDLLAGTLVKEESYFSCLYALGNHTECHYHPVELRKKGGGIRKLQVPDFLLCQVQKNILHHVLEEFPVSVFARAYRPKTSVVENANPHVGAEQILKLDLKDFFGNISFLLIYQFAFPAVYYPPAIRRLLSGLCCYRDALPQGAPTSPAISNLVMKPFDEYIGAWCQERGITYTRYCDDLTFSGNFNWREVKRKVEGFLRSYGFELNEKKTKIQTNGTRQTVTGIVVNEKPQVGRAYRRQLRMEIYYCEKYGVSAHLQRCRRSKPGKQEKGEEVRYLQSLLGKVHYILQVNPQDQEFQKSRETLCRLYKEYT